jgi:hypothetical protein
MSACGSVHRDQPRYTKGALGQALVKEYLMCGGWAVAASGIQDVVDHLHGDKTIDKGDLGSLPDFIITKVAGSKGNPSSHELGQAFYVEVKTHAKWIARDYSTYTRWGEVLLVWVSPKGLRGTWLMRPANGDQVRLVKEADFIELHRVGRVSVKHCDSPDCQRDLRGFFDAASAVLAALPT